MDVAATTLLGTGDAAAPGRGETTIREVTITFSDDVRFTRLTLNDGAASECVGEYLITHDQQNAVYIVIEFRGSHDTLRVDVYHEYVLEFDGPDRFRMRGNYSDGGSIFNRR